MPRGVLAIWHDIVADQRDAVLDWYNREHHPERLGIEGFLRASRFRVIEGGPDVFINYEVRSPEVLRSEAYLARVNAPTDWTRRCMPHFRNNSRTVCQVTYDQGRAVGGYAATIRFAAPGERESALRDALIGQILPEVAASALVVRVQLWEALLGITTIQSNERSLRPGADTTTGWCIAIFASALEPLRTLCATTLAPGALEACGARDVEAGLYGCEYVGGSAT